MKKIYYSAKGKRYKDVKIFVAGPRWKGKDFPRKKREKGRAAALGGQAGVSKLLGAKRRIARNHLPKNARTKKSFSKVEKRRRRLKESPIHR